MASSSVVVMPGWRFAFIASIASLTTRPALRSPARSLSDSTVMRSSFRGGQFLEVYAGMKERFTAYAPSCLEKLSEKGYEHCSNRVFGRCTETEMERKAPPWRPTGLRRGRVRGFSDSLGREILGSSYLLATRSEEHTSELQSRQYLVC